MEMSRRDLTAGSLSSIVIAAAGSTAKATSLSPEEARQIAEDAYIYGYSLVTTEVTRVQMTNVPEVEGGLRAPMNQFANVPRYPPANFRGVSAPNADTLYSVAWLDLSEPQVVSHPDMGERFFLFQIVDLWMRALEATPGKRTTGGTAADYLITGPGWTGTTPNGMRRIAMATRYMVILGRTYANGTDADYAVVNTLQAQYKITPLSAWGHSFTPAAQPIVHDPGFSMTDKPQAVIRDLGTAGYFDMMARSMGGPAPPATADAPMLARMARIGLVPGRPFEKALDPTVQAALADIPKTALKTIEDSKSRMGKLVNGWVVTRGLGVYGTDYLKRAVVAAFGWPANREEDAVYPYAQVDGDGQPLTGVANYTLTFPKGTTPPVRAFWSITMYMIDGGWWFVPNPLNKFTVSPRNALRYDADGSLTVWIQAASPGAEKEANWLPAPSGPFILMLRMYWPNEKAPSILDGSWEPPAVRRVAS